MITLPYEQARSLMRIGDVVAFGGKGFISAGIKLFTHHPVSHVGTILRVEAENSRVQLIESTTLNDKKGVQVNFLSERIGQYDGNIWWLPLDKQVRTKVDWDRFITFLLGYEENKVPYDYRQCLRMAWAPIAHLPGLGFLRNHEDLKKVFCSELVAAAFEWSGAIPFGTDCSDISPADLCSMALYQTAVQLKGSPKDLPHFNTRRVA